MITASVVIHDDTTYVEAMISALLSFPEVSKILIRFNLPSTRYTKLRYPESEKIIVFYNDRVAGFASNHNQNFNFCSTGFFCVLNPDIKFDKNPFPSLIKNIDEKHISVISPSVLEADGKPSDHEREFRRLIDLPFLFFGVDSPYRSKAATIREACSRAGMFMVFKSSAFTEVGGFDDGFFLYYEDTDICRRLFNLGQVARVDTSTSVTHFAKRESHKSFRYGLIHIRSFLRYYIKHQDIFSVKKRSK